MFIVNYPKKFNKPKRERGIFIKHPSIYYSYKKTINIILSSLLYTVSIITMTMEIIDAT